MARFQPIRAQVAQTLLTLIGLCGLSDWGQAALLVNPARPITSTIEVQIIQTSLTNQTQPATVFGNSTQRADIENGIDRIWAQAGIDISFLPTITQYADTFANRGITMPPPTPPRPTSDLTIMSLNAQAVGKWNPDPQVINMFFVEIVPQFNQLTEWQVAGIAGIDDNKIAMFVGDSLLGSANNREAVIGVVAHEIGHNLGLNHTSSGGPNLMSPGGTSEQLTAQQIETVLRSDLLQQASVSGDFTGDGVVDGRDLIAWRNAYGVNPNGDADGDGDTDGRDFLLWQKNYGASGLVALHAVPEPTTCGLLLAPFLSILANSRFARRVFRGGIAERILKSG